MQKLWIVLISGLLSLSSVTLALGAIGVGVGTGKIEIDEPLKPGQVYTMPPVTVINTGDEKAVYGVRVTHRDNQPEKYPDPSWYSYDPETFTLEPGKAQQVVATLRVPLKAEPGNYFHFLEAQPRATVEQGRTVIGVAAASKVYFTLEPANIFQAVSYLISSNWKHYQPWSNRAVIAIGVVAALLLFKRFFNIQVNVRPAKGETKNPPIE